MSQLSESVRPDHRKRSKLTRHALGGGVAESQGDQKEILKEQFCLVQENL
jgi:hypothetical protein